MLVDTGSANTAIAATPDPALGHNEFYDPNLWVNCSVMISFLQR